ncbi:MAG: neutral/alkaline non-lysosomal ceramidase N-terminal domain-containing protein [Bacteroidia bacterium]
MKRIRGLLKILIGLLALIIIGGFIILDRVDYTPYFETDYYQKTRARQDSLMKETQLYSGALQIGFGRVNITPQIGKDDQPAGVFSAVPLAGYGDRKGVSATGVHDSLYVSVIAIQVGEIKRLLVSADMLIIPTNLSTGSSELALKQLGIGRDQIFFSATHTHSSMGGLTDKFVGEMFGGKYNPGLEEWLIQQFCKAMDLAVADLQPGRMGVGSFDAAAHVRNRIVGDRGEEDSEFVMIRLEQNNGKKAVIGAFDGHATTLGGDNLLFSGDYPGFWRKALEETEIDFAVFFAGSVGSHSVDVGGDSFEKMETVGKRWQIAYRNIMQAFPSRIV